MVGRSYNITFNSNIPTTVTTGNTYTITSNSINGNLDSAGIWSINSSNYNMGSTTTTPPNFTSVANGRVNATAQWKSKTISNLYTPTMTGYKFIGWYDQPTGGTKITVVLVEPATTAYSITLYAHWEPITYTVTFHGNDNWNTAQGSYTQTLTFDKVETLTANKFNRDASNNKIYNGEILTEGYSFEGWSHDNAERGAELYSEDAFGKSVNVHLTDGATACWNFTTQPNGNVNLYAIWKKPLSLSFDYTGGYYKTGVVAQLSYDLYNAEYEHTFNISQLYGTVIENGLNSNITKADSEGTNYRFLGFTVDASQTNEPDNNLVVYSNSRLQNYTIHDDKALYATWEPVLNVSIKLNRKLGILQTSNSAYDLKAVSDTADISMECKAGEQGSYTIISPTAEKITVEFDERITNLYEDSSKIYYDTLNPVDSEILVAGQKHGLNRLIYVTDKITARTFCVPAYLGSKYCPTESQDTHYTIIFTVTQDSYYWQNIKGKPAESIEVTGHIYLETADDDSSSVESVLDELRTKLKIRLQ